MQHLFDALALFGAVVLTVLVVRMFTRNTRTSREDAAEGALSTDLSRAITKRARTREKAISGALKSDDPAGELGRLGDERRK